MKFIWTMIGRVLYFLAWPVLYIYLRFSGERTRVIVLHNNKVLLVQNWLGNGQWLLPGGGVFRHERPTSSAVRELKEETGLIVKPRNLKLIGNVDYVGQGLKISLVCYQLNLKTAPHIKIRRQLEVMNYKWVNKNDVLKNKITPDTRQVFEYWFSQR